MVVSTFLQSRLLLIVRGHLRLLVLLLRLIVLVLRAVFVTAPVLTIIIALFIFLLVTLRRTEGPDRLIALEGMARFREGAELGTGKQTAERTTSTQYAAEAAGLSAIETSERGCCPCCRGAAATTAEAQLWRARGRERRTDCCCSAKATEP